MDKSYLDDPEIRAGLLRRLIAEGWFEGGTTEERVDDLDLTDSVEEPDRQQLEECVEV